jgi:hypothetical protein
MNENHIQPTSEQFNHNHTASQDRNQFASANGGHPGTTAMNSVGGTRFNPQGKNAPAPIAWPAGGIRTAATTNNHPSGGHPGNSGGSHPNNHPANHNPPHGGSGSGEHHH